MPRRGKNISTNSSSDIISSAESDSESSSSTESSFGSGDEGSSDSSKVAASNRAPSERYVLPLSIRCFIGVVCPISVVASAVSLILSGIQLNNPNLPNEDRVDFSAFFAAGAVLTCVGSALSMLAIAKHPAPNPQASAA